MKNIEQSHFNFHKTLFEEICSQEKLLEAFREVKRNKGAPGVDDIKISDFARDIDKELAQLKQEVEGWSYKPQPVKLVEIAKNGGGSRRLGIPTVRDRVLQTSIKNALESIIDPTFSKNSYGFRPGRSQRHAILAAKEIVSEGKEYVVDLDLSKFFDRIDHDRLIQRLKSYIDDTRILRLIGMTLRCGVLEKGKVKKSKTGTVQGSPLSPLLSNVVLDELDKELESRKLVFCRYADDCNIYLGSLKAAERVRKSITKFIEKKLKLMVNEEKTKVTQTKFTQFLGMTILTIGVIISDKSILEARAKLITLIPRSTNKPVEKTIEKFNLWYRGWSNYFNMTDNPEQLSGIEAHARRRIRAQFIRNQKKRRHLYRKFVKRGAHKRISAKYAFSNKKTWDLSKSTPAHQAWSNRYFREMGMYCCTGKEQKKIK